MEWLDAEYFGNSIKAWLAAAAAVTLAVGALELVRALLGVRLAKLSERTDTGIDDLLVDIVRNTRHAATAAIGLYVGTRFVELPGQLATLVHIVLTLALAFQAAVWGNVLIGFWLDRQFRSGVEITGAETTGYGAMRFISRVILWSVVTLMALDNLGIDVTALVAGLGVGGIAIALAVQSILGDIFCSLSIVLDKPFEIGDFIIVDDLLGTVEHIGIKTTRLRSLGGEQLVFSNSDLVGSRVRNYKRMWERRVVFEFGVTYQTPVEKVEKIPEMVREIVGGLKGARLDRVHFKSYGDCALIFEVVYYVLDRDYNVYMDVQQALNLGMMRAFAADDIDFAYPTQTLYLHQET